jgi:hypothetical protein
MHAEEILDRLLGVKGGYPSLEDLHKDLDATRDRPTDLTRPRRAWHALVHALMMSVFCFGPLFPLFVAMLWMEEAPARRNAELAWMLVVIWLYPLGCAAWAFGFRGGVSLNFFGVHVRRVAGGRPARWQYALRVLGLFAPTFVAISLAMILATAFPALPALWGVFWVLGVLLLVVQLVLILVYPARAPHDRLAGTVLVPS